MRSPTNCSSALAALLTVSSIALSPIAAQAQDDEGGMYDWKVFLAGAYIAPLSDSEIAGEDVSASAEIGYELGVEWKPSNRFGFELAYLDTTHDIEVDGDRFGQIDFNPLLLTLNFHIINRNAFDWYIGPTAAFIDWGNVDADVGGSAEVDSETTVGVSTGLAIGLGQTFALQFGLRYLDSTAESDTGDEVDIDPLFASFGVAFRF